jgi:hypothetical protein
MAMSANKLLLQQVLKELHEIKKDMLCANTVVPGRNVVQIARTADMNDKAGRTKAINDKASCERFSRSNGGNVHVVLCISAKSTQGEKTDV